MVKKNADKVSNNDESNNDEDIWLRQCLILAVCFVNIYGQVFAASTTVIRNVVDVFNFKEFYEHSQKICLDNS